MADVGQSAKTTNRLLNLVRTDKDTVPGNRSLFLLERKSSRDSASLSSRPPSHVGQYLVADPFDPKPRPFHGSG